MSKFFTLLACTLFLAAPSWGDGLGGGPGSSMPSDPLATAHGGTGSDLSGATSGQVPISNGTRFLATTPDAAIAPISINGSAGTLKWSMPVRSAGDKRIIVVLTGYTAAAPTVLTFPVAFTVAPTLSVNNTDLVISTLTTGGITIPVSTTETGLIIVEGF